MNEIPPVAPPGSPEPVRFRWADNRWAYPAIFALALIVRGGYLAELRGTPLFAVLMGDGQSYDEWARRIAAGDWYGAEVFYQAPLYPYLLALIYRVFGADPWPMRAAQALLDSGSCVLLAAAGRRFFSPIVGVAAGVLLALYAPLIFFCGLIQKPVLDVFFTTLLLLILGQTLRGSRAWLLLAAGATVGLFALTRENALILAPLAPLWALLRFHGARPVARLAWAAAALAGTMLVLVPVGLRNRRIGGEFLITTAQMGPNFYIGNNPAADGSYVPLRPGRGHPKHERADAREIAAAALERSLTPAEVSRYWLGRAGSAIRASPGRWARLLAKKWVMVWNAREYLDFESIEAFREWSVILRTLGMAVNFGILAPLALAGVWLTRESWRDLWVLYALTFSVAASIAAFYVLARYRTPLVPVLALFAAAGGVRLLAGGRVARRGAVVCVVAGAVFVNWPLPVRSDPRAITYKNAGIDLFKAGWAAQERGDRETSGLFYRQSEEVLGRALALEPPNTGVAAETHKMLGTVLRTQERRQEALEHFQQTLAVNPNLWIVQDEVAELLVELGRREEAIPHWQTALRLNPNDAALRFELAGALLAAGRAEDAAEHSRAALALRPGWPEAHLQLARAAIALGRCEEAEENSRAALRFRPGFAEAQAQLAARCPDPRPRGSGSLPAAESR